MIRVFCDFDGTITEGEPFESVLKNFAPELSAELVPEMHALKLTLREGVRRIVESIPSAHYQAMLDSVRSIPLRQGFPEFQHFLAEQSIPLVIVSGGLKDIIATILGNRLKQVDALYASTLDHSGEHLKLIAPWEGETEVLDKARILQQYPDDTPICIGDSTTDLNMAMHCPNVFARDRLAKRLDERNRTYRPFATFHHIMNQWPEMVENIHMATTSKATAQPQEPQP